MFTGHILPRVEVVLLRGGCGGHREEQGEDEEDYGEPCGASEHRVGVIWDEGESVVRRVARSDLGT